MIEKEYRLKVYLNWILEAINTIELYYRRWNIETDSIILDWCLMQLIHIWETVNKIKKKFPEFNLLPKDTIKLRNFAAHDYIWVNISIVDSIVKKHLPEVKSIIKSYLEKK